MEFNCTVKIVDAIMGAGKSQSIINLINNSDDYDIIITVRSIIPANTLARFYNTVFKPPMKKV